LLGAFELDDEKKKRGGGLARQTAKSEEGEVLLLLLLLAKANDRYAPVFTRGYRGLGLYLGKLLLLICEGRLPHSFTRLFGCKN